MKMPAFPVVYGQDRVMTSFIPPGRVAPEIHLVQAVQLCEFDRGVDLVVLAENTSSRSHYVWTYRHTSSGFLLKHDIGF